MQEVDREILLKYELDIKDMYPYRDGTIIKTGHGKKLIRRCTNPPARVLFIHTAKEHLYNNNFKNIDRYVCTSDGYPYVEHDGVIYTITDIIDGNECNFDNDKDVAEASKLLAKLHVSSKGYSPPQECSPRNDLGKLPIYFSKRLDEIKKLKKIAKKGKNKFDYMFLEYVDYYCNLGEDAIEKLSTSVYDELVRDTSNEGLFCHHDFTHHNIIFGNNSASLINFDFCCMELKVYDIANLIRRKMRKCNWDISKANIIIDEYRKVEPLSEKDFYILRIMLQFPQKFWRVVNKYYNSKRSWSERSYLSKLQEVVDEIQYHSEFMSKFDAII